MVNLLRLGNLHFIYTNCESSFQTYSMSFIYRFSADDSSKHQCMWPKIFRMCKRTFNTAEDLGNHLRSVHLKFLPKNQWNCMWSQCGKGSTENRRELIEHLAAHTSEKMFRCDAEACGEGFSWKENLSRHIKKMHPGHTCNFEAIFGKDYIL